MLSLIPRAKAAKHVPVSPPVTYKSGDNEDMSKHWNLMVETNPCARPEKGRVIKIQTTRYLLSIAESLREEFASVGIEAHITDAANINAEIVGERESYNCTYIFLFVWHIQTLPRLSPYWIYNLEQAYRYPKFPLLGIPNEDPSRVKHAFDKAIYIFDYARANRDTYPPELREKVAYMPIPCGSGWRETYNPILEPPPALQQGILFFGAMTPRRREILTGLSYNLPVKIRVVRSDEGYYGADLARLIMSYHVILNIHGEEGSLLETGRINDCLGAGHCRIVSELPAPGEKAVRRQYEDFVHFLPDKSSSTIADWIAVINKCFNGTAKRAAQKRFNIAMCIKKRNWAMMARILTPPANNYLPLTERRAAEFLHHYGTYTGHPKERHRIKCFMGTPIIRGVKLENFGIDRDKEAILIEFRRFPHIEFLLRNAIMKLSTEWQHTVVCGTENYSMISDMCKQICNNLITKIRIIKLDIANPTPSEYSRLLTTNTFWERFRGEKLLIYQEDSILFHGDIQPFLKYDYVGAPWPAEQDDNSKGVGNGGFSLRSKSKLISCLDTVEPTQLTLGNSTLRYMKSVGHTVVPEDVYFSKTMIDFGVGEVADRETAKEFSQETQLSSNPLGGHNFWLATGNQICVSYNRYYALCCNYYQYARHRSGWNALMQQCLDSGVVTYTPEVEFTPPSESAVVLIDSLDQLWGESDAPLLTKPWVGIVHYVDEVPSFLKEGGETLSQVLDAAAESLINCKCLITLSKYLADYIRTIRPNLPVRAIKHPIERIEHKFNCGDFLKRNNHALVQLGSQYRKVSTIYTIKSDRKKLWLSGRSGEVSKLSLEKELRFLNIVDHPINEVQVFRTATDEEYDRLLLNSIIMIPLWNASGNNSVLECMEMNIPAFVTRLPSTEEYLGKDYPMFYRDTAEIERIINDRQLLEKTYIETHNYLEALDKADIRYEHFNAELLKILND